MKILKYGIVLLCTLSLWGCGKGNSAAPATVDPVTKKVHSDPNWLASTHKKTKATDIPNCAECHGGDFKGGIVNVACTKCHPNGPQGGPPHATDGSFLPATQHGAQAKKSLAFCGGCHGNGDNQAFDLITNTNMPSGCASVSCHSQNPKLAHPFGWIPGRGASTTTSHGTAGDLLVSCRVCHGTNLDGATTGGIAPSCSSQPSPIAGASCHFSKPVDQIGVTLGCKSCHGNPPDGPNGPTGPNRANGHTNHASTTGAGIPCSVCHGAFGVGQATHANGVVQLASNFQARFRNISTQATGFAGGTCDNVSCHGQYAFSGQPWTVTTSVINLADQSTCTTNCHNVYDVPQGLIGVGVGQIIPPVYFGPFSGRVPPSNGTGSNFGNNLHVAHVSFFQKVCTECHSLAFHFDNLIIDNVQNVPGGRRYLAPGFAAGTVGKLGGPVGGATMKVTNYDPVTSDCTNTCHASDLKHSKWR